MNLSFNITKRTRRRKREDGSVLINERWVLNYRDPRSGRRHQLFFDRRKGAEARRDALVGDYQRGATISPERASVSKRSLRRTSGRLSF